METTVYEPTTTSTPDPYTKGVWGHDADPEAPMCIVDEHGTTLAIAAVTFRGDKQADKAEQLANAKRIIASVNACAGIPTANLEKVSVAKLVDLLVRIGEQAGLPLELRVEMNAMLNATAAGEAQAHDFQSYYAMALARPLTFAHQGLAQPWVNPVVDPQPEEEDTTEDFNVLDGAQTIGNYNYPFPIDDFGADLKRAQELMEFRQQYEHDRLAHSETEDTQGFIHVPEVFEVSQSLAEEMLASKQQIAVVLGVSPERLVQAPNHVDIATDPGKLYSFEFAQDAAYPTEE